MRALIISASREVMHVTVPPIGEAYVGAYLLEQGHDVRILDLARCDGYKDVITDTIDEFKPDVIGVSMRNIDSTTYPGNLFYYLPLKNVVLFIKQVAEPDIPVILGGSGFSILSKEILQDLNHPIGVFGEGELVFAEILRKLKRGEDPRTIERGVCFLDADGNYHHKGPWIVDDLDILPDPARSLIRNEDYPLFQLDPGSEIWANVQTKRGCNRDCIYCTYRYIEGTCVRYRSPDRVADELKAIHDNLGIKKVFFVDSLLNLHVDKLEALCKAIIERNIDIQWGANYGPRKEFIPLLPLMKESGAAHLAVGVESLDEEMLDIIMKENFVNDALESSRRCAELEIEEMIHILLGGPGETIETARRTLDMLEEFHPYPSKWQGDRDVFVAAGLRIYPHTPLEKIAIKDGIIKEGENLLKPRFYLSKQLDEVELFDLVREYCTKNERWMSPGLGVNPAPDFAPMSEIQFEIYRKA